MLGSAVYKLGHIQFTLESTNQELMRELPHLFFAGNERTAAVETICASNLRGLLQQVIKLHDAYLWVSAACLLSPRGHKILLSGQSSAGKSTTTIALALTHGWKIISEDLTCFDMETDRLVAFPTPCSLKAGTLDLLQRTIGRQPDRLIFGEYVPMSNIHADGEYEAELDLVLHFGNAKMSAVFGTESCSPGEYVRMLLPCSNLARNLRGTDKLAQYVRICPRYKVTGGTLVERMALLLEFANQTEPRFAAGIVECK